MNYYVIGADGQEYGPADVSVLKQWVTETRIKPDTKLKVFETGQVVPASSVTELFSQPAPVPPPASPGFGANYQTPPTPYPRQGMGYGSQAQMNPESMTPLWGIIIRCVLGLILFFVFQGIGVIFAGYALYYAIQIKTSGSKWGNIALVISAVTCGILLIGWMLRLGGVH